MSELLDELRAGRMIVLTDDEHRENEGDLVLPAQFVTPEAITFMLREAKGYLCLSLTERDCERLELSPQAATNTSARGTAFTVSIDGHPKHGFTTGVSAKERARCIQMAIDASYRAHDFVRPGHINPLRSRDGGVLVRTGQTEGSVDLCRLAGLYPAAVIIEIMKDDGEMARVPDLAQFCARHGLKMGSVAQIIEHRLARESLVKRLEPASGRVIRTPLGEFRVIAYESLVDPLPHLALTVGDVGLTPGGERDGVGRDADPRHAQEPVLVRMHRRHLLGDVFGDLSTGHAATDAAGVGSAGSVRAETPRPAGISTGEVLLASMAAIQRAGRGAVVYLRTSPGADAQGDLEGLLQLPRSRGMLGRNGAGDDAPDFSDRSTVPPALREFGIGGQILRDLGIHRIRLLTNKSTALPGLEAFGLEIVERVRVG